MNDKLEINIEICLKEIDNGVIASFRIDKSPIKLGEYSEFSIDRHFVTGDEANTFIYKMLNKVGVRNVEVV